MGRYLNSIKPYMLYKKASDSPYFVDKSIILGEIIPLVDTISNCICITRPRRFGKTVMANMISSFFSKGVDSRELFDKLAISREKNYHDNLNHHNVIHISFNEIPEKCNSFEQYIERITKQLKRDLQKEYRELEIDIEDAVWDILSEIAEETNAGGFIFILDEWDFVFHQKFISEDNKMEFLRFLSNLLKDKAYVSFAYMTGILPIAKYSSGSELNMFAEFSMAKSPAFSEYFGFTEDEVDMLYRQYLTNEPNHQVTREGLQTWYNGYQTAMGERVYNPRSVVFALQYNNLASYWTSSGPYDEVFYYIKNNILDVRDDLALMVSGEAVPSKVQEYASTSMNLQTKDEIFSAMVVYGFLSYEEGKVFIPNKELMDKFVEMLQKESSLGYVNRLAKESDKMLRATLNCDTETMTEILEFAHDTESPLLAYNNEAELSAIVKLVYLSAREIYDIQREDKAGIGYVDYIFYPYRKTEDCIILELKVGYSADEAIRQIEERKYILRFKGKLGEAAKYTGRILAVGIGYDKETKMHDCKVKILG